MKPLQGPIKTLHMTKVKIGYVLLKRKQGCPIFLHIVKYIKTNRIFINCSNNVRGNYIGIQYKINCLSLKENQISIKSLQSYQPNGTADLALLGRSGRHCFIGNFEHPWCISNFSSNFLSFNHLISNSIMLIMVANGKGIDSVLVTCEKY